MDVFMHIPRTAGQSLSQLVLQNYPDRAYFTGDTEAEMRQLRTSPPDCDALMGHVPHGLFPNARHVTFLREPVSRLASEYAFHKNTPGAYHYARIQSGLTCVDWVGGGIPLNGHLIDNALCRFVSGAYVWEGVNRRVLARAKANIANMPAFGITELFAESVLLIGRALGWKHVIAVPTNIKRDADDALPQLSDDIFCRLDTELYAFATDLFHDRIDQLGSLFTEALDAYRKTLFTVTHGLPSIHGHTLGYDQPGQLISSLRSVGAAGPLKRFLQAF